MDRPTTKGSARSHASKQWSPLGDIAPPRWGLATKFTVPVALCISLLIILLSVVSYHSMASALEAQAETQGVFAARLAAAPEIDSWDEKYNTLADLQRRIAEIDASLALAAARLDLGPGAASTGEQAKLRADLARYDEAQRALNKRRLSGLLSRGVLDVWIVAGTEDLKASASGATSLRYSTERTFASAISPESQISIGGYPVTEGGRTRMIPARFFRHPITDRAGRAVGIATVIFSEEGLIAALDSLRTRSLILCILGVLGTAAAAFFTSRAITRPLGGLVRDIQAVAEGNLKHRTVARSRDEIGILAQTFDRMTRSLEAAEAMRSELAAKEHEVSVAQEVQDRLFPERLPEVEGLRIEGRNLLSGALSSDLFDALVLPDGRVGILVMTASGRGVPAAIVLSMARSLFRARAGEHGSPEAALSRINALLSPDLRRGMFVSAVYAVIDPRTGEGSVVAPGHRAPVAHFVAASGGIRRLPAGGIALGLDRGPVFDRSLAPARVILAPGDRLILASEGALLAGAEDEAPRTEEAFLKLLLAGARRGLDAGALLGLIFPAAPSSRPKHDITLVQAIRSP